MPGPVHNSVGPVFSGIEYHGVDQIFLVGEKVSRWNSKRPSGAHHIPGLRVRLRSRILQPARHLWLGDVHADAAWWPRISLTVGRRFGFTRSGSPFEFQPLSNGSSFSSASTSLGTVSKVTRSRSTLHHSNCDDDLCAGRNPEHRLGVYLALLWSTQEAFASGTGAEGRTYSNRQLHP